jgi:hypothetical protein
MPWDKPQGIRVIRAASLLGPRQHREQLQEEYHQDSTNDSNSSLCSHLLSPLY